MFQNSKSFRFFIVASILIVLTALTVTATQSTRFAFIDSVKEFFGMASTATPIQSPAPKRLRDIPKTADLYAPEPQPMFLTNGGSITAYGSALTENFDGLPSTVATGVSWTDNSTISGAYSDKATYNVGTGSSNAGALYSFGVAGTNVVTDRALGGVASSGSGTNYWAFRLTNNTGGSIGSLAISYTGEQWRDGGATTPAAQTTSFQYQVANAGTITDANVPSTGWTGFSALSFASPTFTNTGSGVALDGNAPANRTAKSSTITFGTPVANGQEIWIRWEDLNDAGNDHGLAIDDFSVTAIGAPSISKSFATSPINVGGTSLMTIAVTNPNSSTSLTGVAFTDTLPAGLTAPDASFTQCGGTLTIASNVITLSGATIGFSSTCTSAITVTASGAATGVLTNTTSTVTSTNGGTGNSASANITVTPPPPTATVTGSSTICSGGSGTVTVTVSGGTAPYTVVLTNGGGTQTGAGPTFNFSVSPSSTTGYTLAAGSVDATSTAITTGNTATITVNQPPTLSNAGPDQSVVGSTATLAGNTPSVGTGTWSVVSGPGGGSFASPNSPTSLFTGTPGVSYTLRWTISNSPCSSSTNDVVVTLDKASTALAALTVSSTEFVGNTLSVSTTLTRTSPPAGPVAGETVTFTLTAPSSAVTNLNTTTDGSGGASVNFAALTERGPYTVSASYAGNSTLNSSTSNTRTVTVYQRTSLVLSPASGIAGNPTAVSATLTAVPSGAPISGQTVNFDFGGVVAPQTTVTSGSGVATVNTFFVFAGTYAAVASFSNVGGYFADDSGNLVPETSTGDVTIAEPTTVTSLSPTSGPTAGGNIVTINGTSLSGATTVTFGGDTCPNVTVISATQVTCTAPPHAAGTVDVIVTTPSGSSANTAADDYTYIAPNAPPVNSVPGTQTTDEDAAMDFSVANANQISISDADVGGADMLITLSVTNGTLTLSDVTGLVFSVGDGTNDVTMTFTGTLSAVNNAISTVTFTPAQNYFGSATLTIIANDQGNTGTGGPLTDTDTVTINITAVVDPPFMVTNTPNSVTSNSASLNGTANADGSSTTAYFRYSTTDPGTCNDTFGTRAPASGGTSIGSGFSAVSYSQSITGLSPSTLYYYCAIGSNSAGVGFGSVLQFTTLTPPPTTIVSLTRQNSNPTNQANVFWTIEFAGPVDGLTASNFALVNSGLTGPGINSVAPQLPAPTTKWNIQVATGTGTGTLGLNFVNDSGMTPGISTSLPFVGEVYDIDHDAPATPQITGSTPTSPSSNAAPIINGTAEAGSTVTLYTSSDCTTVALGSGPATAGNFAIGITVATNTTTNIYARAVDAVGNASGCSTVFAYTHDDVPPTTSIDSSPPSTTASTSATFEFSGSDSLARSESPQVPGLTFECALDAPFTFSSCSSPKNYTGLSIGSHTFKVRATDPTGNTDATAAEYTWEITTNPVNLSVSTNAADEATSTVVTVTATADGAVSGAQTVSVAANGTNITAGDYNFSSTTITIPDGQATGSVTFTVSDDSVYEGTETATLTISNPSSGIVLGTTQQQNVSLADNDTAPTLSISDVSLSEGDGPRPTGVTLYNFTVTRTGETELVAGANFDTTGVTATEGVCTNANDDFLGTGGNFGINPGGATGTTTITVQVCGDTVFETNETFNVVLSAPVGATITDDTGFGTIQNDDTAPTILISDVTFTGDDRPSSGCSNAFEVSIQGSTEVFPITVNYQTADDTAVAGQDYNSTSGTLTFNSTAFQCVPVTIINDPVNEPTQQFFMNLSVPTNATIADGQGVGTIPSGDPAPTFTISSVSQFETNAGTTNFVFDVTKVGQTSQNATVNYSTVNGTAGGVASCGAGVDFRAVTGSLSFGPADTVKQVTVEVCGDMNFESDETFLLGGTATVASVPTTVTSGTGTILNDDCTAPPAGMTAWYPGQNNANDVVGGNNATLVGSPGYAAGKVGQAFDFNGTSQFAQVIPGTALATVPQFSADGWFYWRGHVNPTGHDGLIVKMKDGVTDAFSTFIATTDNSILGIVDGNTFSSASGVVPTNQWFHLAQTYDGTNARIYLNGIQVATFAHAGPLVSNGAFYIGNRGGNSHFFNGLIDEVEVFNQALTPTQVANLVAASGAGKCQTPIVQFAKAAEMEDESQTASVIVRRDVSVAGATDVTAATVAGGTATGGAACTAGIDYKTTSQLLSFGNGDSEQTMSIEICPDLEYESPETIRLQLTGPTGAAVLGGRAEIFLTINDTATQFTSGAPINISGPGPASPYPSTINVSGAPTVNGGMRVTLYDVEIPNTDNIDILLVGPLGQKMVIMGDAGGMTPGRVTLTFDDAAGQVLPDGGPLASGKYEPTTWEPVIAPFPGSAPGFPYVVPGNVLGGPPSLGSAFGAANPNGQWRLFVRDDAGQPFTEMGSAGAIAGGWGLQFLVPTAAGVSVSGRVTTAESRGIRGAIVTVTGNSLATPINVMTGVNGRYIVEGLTAGETYVITIRSRRFVFSSPSRIVTLNDNVTGADFVANPATNREGP